MTRLVIFSPDKQRDFDTPCKLNAKKRASYFSLDYELMAFVQTLRTPINQIGFVLQLGYFRANGKFFTPTHFRSHDIRYVMHMLGFTTDVTNIACYQEKTIRYHRTKILEFLQWQPLHSDNQEKIKQHIQWNIPQQLTPKRVFYAALEYCCYNKIELPSYHFLANTITDAYNVVEINLIENLTQKLTPEHREKLDQILTYNAMETLDPDTLPSLTHLKKINQSLRPMDIKATLKDFALFKDYFQTFKPIMDQLNLPDQLTEYFSIWTQKAKLDQLNSFSDKHKTYLRLLCYLKHHFYTRHDLLADIYLQAVQNGVNSAHRKENNREQHNKAERNHALKKVLISHQNSRALIAEITAIVHASDKETPHEKLNRITTLVDTYNTLDSNGDKIQMFKFEQTLNKIANNQLYFDSLEDVSRKLQCRVSELISHLTFDKSTSTDTLLTAIDYFIQKEGNLGNDAPRDFLNAKEKAMCTNAHGKLNISLYKVLFFIHIANGIKSGALNLLYSYRYKAIQQYLIDDKTWDNQKIELIKTAGLEQFLEVTPYLSTLEESLNAHYKDVNERFLANQNPYLLIDEKYHITLKTLKTDSSDEKYASKLLDKAGYVPLVKILSDINHITHFTSAFKHHSIKHTKMKSQPEFIFAGITAKGRNMSLNHLANSSIGIKVDALHNVVNWCFSASNIQEANDIVIHMTDKLFLSSAFQYDTRTLHTSSDGRKVTVAVDSILANYSYKYFGNEKGVTIYLFIDERQILFYSTVISASEREAAYVIDGLLHNNVVKSDIHSTDMHGFTEIIFAATHFIGTLYAPRPKSISKLKLYGFTGRKTYKRLGYKILPNRGIHVKLIEENWDTILRFMTTIKLKYTPASYLLKRLSSYAKEHPLYKTLKEFGRIIKSLFLLTYMDDLTFRQRIEKQLNKVEFANRFSKAIIGNNKQEFDVGEKEEQEMMAGCNILIQNCINLWNMLYLSQLIANNPDPLEQKKMFDSIAKGSSSNWSHINFQGEFDFFKYKAANQNTFDMDKILGFKLGA